MNAKLKNQEAAAKAGGKATGNSSGKADSKAGAAVAEQPAADAGTAAAAAAPEAPGAAAAPAVAVLSPAEQLKALLADDEALASAPLAQLVGVPEESALQLATRLAKVRNLLWAALVV